MNTSITKAACLLLVLIGINTGIVGLLNINLLTTLLGQYATVLKITDIIIGCAAVIMFSQYFLNTDTVSSR